MITLWDLLTPRKKPAPAVRAKPTPRAVEIKPAAPAGTSRATKPEKADAPARETAQDRYDRMTKAMLKRYGVRVRKWRSGMSGVAWEVTYRDGAVSRLIEAPYPKGPMSAAVFLHEIGHHAIGFHTYSPRCLEEYHAWRYAIEQMERWQITVTDRVRERMHDSLHYAIEKARRRGLKRLPTELAPFVEPRVRRARVA